MANPNGVLPPEGREEAKKKKGAPADPTNDTEVRGYLTEPGMRIKDMNPNLPDDPATEAVEPDREKHYLGRGDEAQVADPPASTTRGGYEDYEQGEATGRQVHDKPAPDFMPNAANRDALWEALTPEQKKAILSVSAAPSPLPGQGGYQSSKGRGSEITGGGRQPDPQRKTKEGKYIYGEKAPMERIPDFYTEMDTLRRAAQNEE